MSESLRLRAEVRGGGDDAATAELTTALRDTLLGASDAESVERVAGSPPLGARGDLVQIGQLLITVAPTLLGPVVEVVRSWVSTGDRRVLLKGPDGAEIQLDGASPAQQERALRAFLDRYTGAA